MKRHCVVLATVGLVLLLTACGPATSSPEARATEATVTAVASPTAPSQPTAALTPTPVAPVTEASPAPTEAFPTPNPNPQCTAAPISSDPNIQPATADDWSRGPAGAEITLIEYGDFQ